MSSCNSIQNSGWQALPIIQEEQRQEIVDPYDTSRTTDFQDSYSSNNLILKTSIKSSVWLGVKIVVHDTVVGAATGGMIGAAIGLAVELWAKNDNFIELSEPDQESSAGDIEKTGNPQMTQSSGGQYKLTTGMSVGGKIGAAIGLCWGVAKAFWNTYTLTIELNTVHASIWPNSQQDQKFHESLAKANRIFEYYIKLKQPNPPEDLFCPITENLFIYPVEAGDKKIYEHHAIYYYVGVTYREALKKYHEDRVKFSNDPNVTPPSSSPYRCGEVCLDKLRLRTDIMKRISELMKSLFADLNRVCPILENELKYVSEKLLFNTEIVTGVAINEQKLAEKLANGHGSLTLEEGFYVYGIFQHYLKQIRERDNKIYSSINDSLQKQKKKGIIDTDTHAKEMRKLLEWYHEAEELYKYEYNR